MYMLRVLADVRRVACSVLTLAPLYDPPSPGTGAGASMTATAVGELSTGDSTAASTASETTTAATLAGLGDLEARAMRDHLGHGVRH